MRVLGLVASPRRGGNSEIVVQEMMRVLPADWEKAMIRLNDLRIERCKACYACLPRDRRCILDDDLNFFLDGLKAADKVIIAAPVYALGQQTSLKLINDRIISIQNNSDEYFTGKQCVIVVPHTVKNWEGYGREAAMHFARFLGLDVTGVLVVNASLPGDIINFETMTEIEALAKSLIDNSVVDFTDPDKVYCPDCGSSLLQIFREGKWRCVICNSVGNLLVNSGEFTLSWYPGKHRRFTLEGAQEHGRVLTEVKNEFLRRKDAIACIHKRYKNCILWVKPDR